jgi:hypothetical protein
MEIKITPKIKDYVTTLLFAAVPVIIAYQAQIGAYIPVEYALLFTIGMGILSQIAANKRTEIAQATVIVNDKIVQANDIIDDNQAKLELLQAEIDAKQEEIKRIAGLRRLVEEPVSEELPIDIDEVA